MMISKEKSLGVVGGLLAGLVLGMTWGAVFSAGSPSRAQAQALPSAQAPAKPQGVAKALAEERLKLARQGAEMAEEFYANSRTDGHSLAAWQLRQVEALRAVGAGKAELVPALEKYVEKMQSFAEMAKARRMAARGTQMEELDWQYRLIEGETWLNLEKSR